MILRNQLLALVLAAPLSIGCGDHYQPVLKQKTTKQIRNPAAGQAGEPELLTVDVSEYASFNTKDGTLDLSPPSVQ